jgi:hypothetical protein
MGTFLLNARLELLVIINVLEKMDDWAYLTNEEKEIKKDLEKRKTFLEFLLENA